MDAILDFDKALFFMINGRRFPFMDTLMPLFSETWFWTPVFLILAFSIVKSFHKRSIWILLALALMIVFTDKGSGIIKKSVKRFRPTHEISMKEQVITLNGYTGGKYGFFSSHAANYAAIALFFSLWYRAKSKLIPVLLWIWAFSVCYSRMYLGVHYPTDIFCGMLWGTTGAFLTYFSLRKFDLVPSENKLL